MLNLQSVTVRLEGVADVDASRKNDPGALTETPVEDDFTTQLAALTKATPDTPSTDNTAPYAVVDVPVI